MNVIEQPIKQVSPFFKEFKEFATRGNVMDLAVGVIIGAAFGKVVDALVTNVIMPPLGALLPHVDCSFCATVTPGHGTLLLHHHTTRLFVDIHSPNSA